MLLEIFSEKSRLDQDIRNLTTFSRNVRAHVLKTPTVYFTDLGLRNAPLGLGDLSQIEKLGQPGPSREELLWEPGKWQPQ